MIPGFEPLGVPKLGILGAAIATVASYMVIDVLMTGELYLVLDRIPISRVIVSPVAIALAMFGGLFAARALIPGTALWIVVTTAGFAVAYWGAVLLVQGLNDEDVMIIESVCERYGIDHPAIEFALRHFA